MYRFHVIMISPVDDTFLDASTLRVHGMSAWSETVCASRVCQDPYAGISGRHLINTDK